MRRSTVSRSIRLTLVVFATTFGGLLTSSPSTSTAQPECAIEGDTCPDCPSPTASRVPECVRVSPGGELPLEMVIRSEDGTPLAGVEVSVIFSPTCSERLTSCDDDGGGIVITGITNAEGGLVLEPRLGGCCVEGRSVLIEARGHPIACYDYVGSPDQDGDGHVTLGDFVLFEGLFLLDFAPCGDLVGCNLGVGLDDFVEFQRLFLTGCP